MGDILAFARDFAIILLALETIVIGVFLLILVWEIRRLINMLNTEIKPILQSVDETTRTVRGTTTFVSDNFVTPMVRVSSFASGVAKALQIIAGRK
ncbi:MAG: hypothetical protein WCF84_07350 [Anaerolineae bacterium]